MAFFGGHPNAQGLFAQLAGQLGGGIPHGPYEAYLRAYSVAMLPGKQRENVAYGGKIIMPPSALATLTSRELPFPWLFHLSNPANPAASTHSGVLEFIAEEGHVHLPQWMMTTLRLQEGDPIRITEATLPKGQFVKFQAQHTNFLEISDPKAVLEQAMRNFSTLTQGDIIEIIYNGITFGLLVMETRPGGEGINCHDTDLEVDFAAPVGWVEPERPKAAPPPTMASKLKIDLNSSSPGSSRPGSSLGGGFAGTSAATAVSKGGDQWESFKGKGETLAGRKTKGKGISVRKAEEVAEDSKIYRTDQHRIVSNDTYEGDVKVPAALNLPFGQLFFGFNITPYVPPAAPAPSSSSSGDASFAGSGNTLNDRQPASAKGKEKAPAESTSQSSSWSGQGQTLGGAVPRDLGPVGAGGARVPRVPQRTKQKETAKKKQRSPSPDMDWGVDDDDVIMIDSD